jgi:hypothetical protein
MTMTVSAMVAVVRCDIVSYGNGRKMWHCQLWWRS